MGEIRYELILRARNLNGDGAERLTEALTKLVGGLQGVSLSIIEREHFQDHALHVARHKIL